MAIESELILSDISRVEKALEKLKKSMKTSKEEFRKVFG